MTGTQLPELATRIDSNLSQLPVPGPEATSRGLLASLAAVRSWLDEPGITWTILKERIAAALRQETAAHKTSVPGRENTPAWARGDALSAVQAWMTEFEKAST